MPLELATIICLLPGVMPVSVERLGRSLGLGFDLRHDSRWVIKINNRQKVYVYFLGGNVVGYQSYFLNDGSWFRSPSEFPGLDKKLDFAAKHPLPIRR